MRLFALLASLLAALSFGDRSSVVSGHGVQVTLPQGWHLVTPLARSGIDDPKTLLVGASGPVTRGASACPLAEYRVPRRGAVVVVLGWSEGGTPANRPGRAPLQALHVLRRHTFECFGGRGAAAQVTLNGRVYQVNVMA